MRREKRDELNHYLDELRTVRRELIENPKRHFITSKSYRYFLNNGRSIPREQLLKNGTSGSAVMVAPRLDNGEFIVVIEPRVFTEHGIAMSFPAGYIELGEEPEFAALRELREETGYTSDELIHLDSFYQDEGVSEAYNHSFLALNAYKKYDQELGQNEIVRYMSLTLDEILEVEKMGIVSGSNTKLTLCRINDYMKGR